MGFFDWLSGGKKNLDAAGVSLDQGYQPVASPSWAVVPPPKNPSGLPEPKETPPMPKVKKPRKSKADKVVDTPKVKSAKDIANERGEPYVDVVNVQLDIDNIGNGAFELDWNEIFVAKLVKAGYKGKDDQALVEQWFNDVCRNVLAENYEQEMADPELRQSMIARRDMGNGRTEVS